MAYLWPGDHKEQKSAQQLPQHQQARSATDRDRLSSLQPGQSTQIPTPPVGKKKSRTYNPFSGLSSGCPRDRFLSQWTQSADGEPAHSGGLGNAETKRKGSAACYNKRELVVRQQTLERAGDDSKLLKEKPPNLSNWENIYTSPAKLHPRNMFEGCLKSQARP